MKIDFTKMTQQEIVDYFEKIKNETNELTLKNLKFEQDLIDDESTPLEFKEILILFQRKARLSSELSKIDDRLDEIANEGKKIIGYDPETFKRIYEK